MAILSFSRYTTFFFAFMVFRFQTVASYPVPSFSIKRFDQQATSSGSISRNNNNRDSEITLLGDAKIVSGGSVEITGSSILSAGRVMYARPIRFFRGKDESRKPMSFSTYFSFSISPESGDGLALVFLPSSFRWKSLDGRSFGVPSGLDKGGGGVLIVEFDTSMDVELGDPNGNHVGVDLGSLVSATVSNVSEINLALNSGDKLQAWIDYDASSKRLEVRLCGSSGKRPDDPLISYPIDLLEVWKDEEVFVGLSSSNGNSTQISSVHSWSFRLRQVPTWLHSEPVDPKVLSHESKPAFVQGRSSCSLRILAALIFGAACGALVFFVLFLWATFAGSRNTMVVPAEYPVHPVEFGYKKMKPVAEKVGNDEKK